ncbi:MAG TPA: TerB family tellurite resistance protein [Thermoanaerobaculia bacterium]
MKRLLDLFGLRGTGEGGGPGELTAAVRTIAESLPEMEAQRARFLAAFAFLLGRAAHADLDVSDTELVKMAEIVERYGDLPADQARLVVEIVRREHELRGATQSYQVAREFRRIASREQREELLHCVFAVSAADDSISGAEEKQARQMAEELGFSHREYVEIRSRYHHKRSVIQRLRGS